MPRAHARTAALACSVSAVVSSIGFAGAEEPAAGAIASPTISVTPETSGNVERVADARARFAQAELALPDLHVAFHADDVACDGHDGLFRTTPGVWTVEVCSDLDYILLHEFAHAWAEHTLTPADRRRYLDARGLRTWSGPDVPYRERGTEDAAFIVQQNLRAIGIELTGQMWDERIAAYETLTGRASPAGTDQAAGGSRG